MSSAYSAPINYGESIPLQSIQTIGMVQTAMQQKYDANLAKVDEIVSQFSSINLARDEDKKYLGERLQTLLSTVDNAKGLNWTDGNTVRMLSSHISKAIDPYIVQQVGITRQVKDYMQTAAKKKEKNPDLYSDDNYSYGLDKAGYKDYMAGKTHTLGSLEYTDYHDPQKNLIEPLEKWAEKLGFQKTINTQTGEYYFVTENKETLSKERINDYINMRLDADPKLKKQMTINAWKEFSGVSDDTFKENYINVLAENKEKTDKVLLETQASLLKYPKDSQEYKNASQLITAYQEQSANLKKQMDSPDKYYSRENAEYTSYTSGLKKQITDTYAQESVTDIKYNWTPEWVYKAKNKTAAGDFGVGLGVVTEVEAATVAEQQAPNYFRQDINNVNNDYKSVVSNIEADLQNDPYYSKLPKDKKTAFVNDVIKGGDKIRVGNGLSENTNNSIARYRQSALKYKESEKIIVEHFDNKVKDVYEELSTGEGVNWTNLSQTLPQTAKAIKAGKGYDDLTAKEKAMVKADIATNIKNTTENEEDKSYLNIYVKNIEKQNPGVFVVNKKVLNQPDTYTPKQPREAANAVDKWYSDYQERAREAGFNVGENIKGWVRGLVDTVRKQDENLSEIGVWDVTKTDSFKGSIQSLKNTLQSKLSAGEEPMSKQMKVTFNADIEAEKPIVNVLNSLFKAKSGNEVPKGQQVSMRADLDRQVMYLSVDASEQQLNLKGTGYTTVFQKKDVEVPFSEIQPQLLRAYDLSRADFTFNVKNPQKYEKVFTSDIPNSQDENSKKINAVIEKHQLPDTYVNKLLTDPASLGFTTKEDYYNLFGGRVDSSTIEQVTASNYDVKMYKKPNIGFYYDILKDGKKVGNSVLYIDQMTGKPVETINEGKFLLETPYIINDHIIKTLSTYATR